MAKIVKLTKDNVQVYPQTITDAVADVETSLTLSEWMRKTETSINDITNSESSDIESVNASINENKESIIQLQTDIADLKSTLGIGTENTEGIDNLTELLTFFKGVKDTDTFVAIMESLKKDIEGSALTAESNDGEYEDFDTILDTKSSE